MELDEKEYFTPQLVIYYKIVSKMYQAMKYFEVPILQFNQIPLYSKVDLFTF